MKLIPQERETLFISAAALQDRRMKKYLQKKQERRTAETPFSTTAAAGSGTAITEMDCANLLEHIQVGSYYQIDHSSLPPNSPVQLFSIRLVMVSMKTQKDVALRYPSICSLRAHFSNWTNNRFGGDGNYSLSLMNPANDEKYVMEAVHADQVLYRRVTSEEFVKRRDSWDFWVVENDIDNNASKAKELLVVVNENDNDGEDDGLNANEDDEAVVCKKGTCLSMLKSTGMVRWGNQHRVKFIDRHREDMAMSKGNVGWDHDEDETVKEDMPNKDGKVEIIDVEEDEEEEDEEEEEEEEKEKGKALVHNRAQTTPSIARRKNRKRKCRQKYTYKNQTSRKKLKQESNKVVKRSSGGKKCFSRWSVERYKLAEENMLKIMKAKGAVVGNPIMRAALRQEARKMIGDTGLLDHLLKHMAGKLAPGGEERFRRRHNADGAMEYWLESANLVDIRKMAGVQDSYWTPPPGWTPGDNLSQDPNCAREIKQLKEEMVKLKREVEALAHKTPQEDRALTQNSFYNSQSTDNNSTAALSLEDKYEDLMKKQEHMQKQLLEVSDSLEQVKEEMEKSRNTRADLGTADKEKAGKRIAGEQAEQRGVKRSLTLNAEAPKHSNTTGGDGGRGGSATGRAEEKAAKIERLKSGFRICRPQGTFLWPSSNTTTSTSPHQLVVLTPPSVNSSSTVAAELKQPPSPVRPTAKRGGATMTLASSLTKSSGRLDDDGSSIAATEIGSSPSVRDDEKRICATSIELIDLNDAFGAQVTSSPICTYRRRTHQAGSSPSWLVLTASDSSSHA